MVLGTKMQPLQEQQYCNGDSTSCMHSITPARNLKHRVVDAGVTILHAGEIKDLDTPEHAGCGKELIVAVKGS